MVDDFREKIVLLAVIFFHKGARQKFGRFLFDAHLFFVCTSSSLFIRCLVMQQLCMHHRCMHIFRGVESFTISTINFSIHGSNKRFSTNYMKARWLNQAYLYVLKLRDNYYIVLIRSFGSITGNILLL